MHTYDKCLENLGETSAHVVVLGAHDLLLAILVLEPLLGLVEEGEGGLILEGHPSHADEKQEIIFEDVEVVSGYRMGYSLLYLYILLSVMRACFRMSWQIAG